MKQKLALTGPLISRAEPADRPYRLWDTKVPGLFVRIQPSGVRTFNVQWSRRTSKAIGRHPNVTVDAARRSALDILADAAANGVPAAAAKPNEPAQIETLGSFVNGRYAPHIEATAKAGRATVHCIRKQFSYLFDRALASIAQSDWDAFKAMRLNAGLHPATVNRDLDRLKAALSTAVAWGLIATNPLAGVKRIRRGIETRVRHLSPAEERRLRKALEARDEKFRTRRASGNAWRVERGREELPSIAPEAYADHITPLTLLALNTGCRRGELTQLTWADIDLRKKLLTVKAGYAKSGRARHIPLNREAVAVLKQWRLQHSAERRQPDRRLFLLICPAKAWARLMLAAKIEDFRFHDLRHTFASKLVAAGVDLNTVRELLGHGDIAMTLRYAHLAPEHKAAAVERLLDR